MSKIYVTMTDKFCSHILNMTFNIQGKGTKMIDKIVFECDSMDEANIIVSNANDRTDMKNINICSKRPSYPATRYNVTWITKANIKYSAFYKRGSFKKGE